MKILLSPAKTLDFETPLPTDKHSLPRHMEQSRAVNAVMRQMDAPAIAKLMKLSEKLSQLNYDRCQKMENDCTPLNARPAMYAFAGDVYTGLDAYSIGIENLERAQDSLRILSGLYGMLRGLDLVQPYRLEMGTRIAVEDRKNLYDFWKETITQELQQELMPDELVVNLASVEYSKAVDLKDIDNTVITPIFKDRSKGQLKVISFFAKKARGLMARYLIEDNVQNLQGIEDFEVDGYAFAKAETQHEHQPVFTR